VVARDPQPLLVATPQSDYVSEALARGALEPELAGWAAAVELTLGTAVEFHYTGARVRLPRAEWQGEEPRYRVSRELGLVWEINSALPLVHTLPGPTPFQETPGLRGLRERIRDYRHGRDRLLAVGYYTYTLICREYGGAKRAPLCLNVEPEVLQMLNTLTSIRSSARDERKATRTATLSEAERLWVESAVTRLALRMGEVEAGAAPSLLRMLDLPSLSAQT
jgi:hypothetical protein